MFTAGCSLTASSLTPARRSCSGVPPLVASVYYRSPHLESALSPSLRRRLCETSASLLMPISACACTSSITSRRRLRSSTSSELVVPLSQLVTVGERSFAAAGPSLWNTLPEDITSAPSLLVFRRKLKTHLFRQSCPDIVL